MDQIDVGKLGKLELVVQSGAPDLNVVTFVFEHGRVNVKLSCDESVHKLEISQQLGRLQNR